MTYMDEPKTRSTGGGGMVHYKGIWKNVMMGFFGPKLSTSTY